VAMFGTVRPRLRTGSDTNPTLTRLPPNSFSSVKLIIYTVVFRYGSCVPALIEKPLGVYPGELVVAPHAATRQTEFGTGAGNVSLILNDGVASWLMV